MHAIQFTGVPSLPVPDHVTRVLESAWLGRAICRIRYRGLRGVTEWRICIRSVLIECSVILLNCNDLEAFEPR
jgi:hypothetical protein